MTTELPAQQMIRIRAGELDAPLWRNNSGAWHDGNRSIRYGLGNDSKKLSETFKSLDLIGITPTLITARHVGRVLGVFTAVDAKAPDWNGITQSDKIAQAQENFIQAVLRHGGYAGFARSVAEYERIIGRGT